MAGVEASWEPMGSSPERGKRGKEEGSRGALLGTPWGEGGVARSSWLLMTTFHVLLVLNVRRKQQAGRRRRGGNREEKEKEGKRKEEKKKKYGFFSNLKIFGKKNKR
jgi:hypothetical protein